MTMLGLVPSIAKAWRASDCMRVRALLQCNAAHLGLILYKQSLKLVETGQEIDRLPSASALVEQLVLKRSGGLDGHT